MNKSEYNQLLKKSKQYYKSYNDLFLRSRRKAILYRYLSALEFIPTKLIEWSVIPIIPVVLWLLNKYFFKQNLPLPIIIENLEFLSIWLNSLLFFSSIYFLFFGIIMIFYRIQKKNIIPRDVYPFSLLSEAIIEINSYSINKDERRLDRAIDFFYDYNFIEKKDDLILIKPLGNTGYSIGTRGNSYKKIIDTLNEIHWFEATQKSIKIAEAFDFFHDKIYESLRNDIEILSIVKAVEGLQVYEYILNKRSEFNNDKFEEVIIYSLDVFQKNMSKVISIYDNKIEDVEEDVEEATKYKSASFNRILPHKNLLKSLFKWFVFLILGLGISATLGMYMGDLIFDTKILAAILASATAGSVALSLHFIKED